MAKETVGVKLDPALLARVDALAPRLATRWRSATRSDALRAAIELGVEQLEAGALEAGAGWGTAPPAPAVGSGRR